MTQAQVEAATSLSTPTIDDVVRRAYRRAGLVNAQQSPTIAQAGIGRDLLGDISDSLAAEGIFMRAVQWGYVSLVTGQNVYTLPENVYDIVGDGAYIDPTQSQVPFQSPTETAVVMKPREVWQGLSSKAAQSQPTIGYFAREAPSSTLYVWPMPSATESGGQIRFAFHVTRPDVNIGTNTMPFERYWTEYFVWQLAHLLAVDNSLMDVAGYCAQQAEMKKAFAKGYSRQQTQKQAVVDHQTRWSRGRR